jgi:predicted RNA-binding Zn-ribbon protein involved in translation (DUF1610 family)
MRHPIPQEQPSATVSMKRIAMRFLCPHCKEAVDIRPICAEQSHGFTFDLGIYHCPGCGKELALLGEWHGPQRLGLQLVDPAAPWDVNEILDREG